jgi:SWI/SNF-related matrix-associated actin-dependent regulator of chromatin subfamily A member 5
VAIKLPSRRELTLLVPLTEQQHDLYRQFLCSLDSSTLEVVMREDTAAAGTATATATGAGTSSQNTSSTDLVPLQGCAAGAAGSTELTRVASSSSLAKVGSSGASSAAAAASSSGDSDWRKLMNLLLQLRKICNHTYLLPDIAPDPYEIDEGIVGGSGKLLV